MLDPYRSPRFAPAEQLPPLADIYTANRADVEATYGPPPPAQSPWDTFVNTLGKGVGALGGLVGWGVGSVMGGIAGVLGSIGGPPRDFEKLDEQASGVGLKLNLPWARSVQPLSYGGTPDGAVRLIQDTVPSGLTTLTHQFLALGQWQRQYDPKAFADWQAALREARGAGGHAGEVLSQYIRKWGIHYSDLTPTGLQGWYDVAPELAFAPSGSLGQFLGDAFSFISLPRRYIEKAAAKASGSSQADIVGELARIVLPPLALLPHEGGIAHYVMAGEPDRGSRLNELLWRAKTGQSLTPVEQEAVRGITEKGWTDEHAYNFLVREGQGYSSNPATQVATSIALDPTILAQLGSAIPARLATRGLAAAMAAEIRAGAIGKSAEEAAAALETAQRLEALHSGLVNRIGTSVLKVRQDPVLGPAFRAMRAIVDPIGAYYSAPRARAAVDVFSAAGLEGTTRGFGWSAVTSALRRAREWDAAGDAQKAYGMAALNLARQWMGETLIGDLARLGAAGARRVLSSDVLEAAAKNQPKDAVSRLADFVMKKRHFYFTEADKEQLAERMARLVNQPVEVTREAVAKMSADEAAVWHAMTYYHAFADFKNVVAGIPPDAWGPLEKRLSDLVLLNPHNLDSIAAQELLDRLREAKGPERVKIWNEAASTYDRIEEIGRLGPRAYAQAERNMQQLERLINSGMLHTAVTEKLPEEFVQGFLSRWIDEQGRPLWRLGFKPSAEMATGLMYDDRGRLVQAFSPSIDHVIAGIEPSPSAFGLARDLAERAGPLAEPAGRAIDSLESIYRTALDAVSSQRLLTSIEQRFIKNMRDLGYSSSVASKVFRATRAQIYEQSKGLGGPMTVAGMTPDEFWRASDSPLRELVGEKVAKRDVFNALIDAAGGDMRVIGLTSGLAQRIRRGLVLAGIDPGNRVGYFTIRVYNLLRYQLNPLFYLQALTDAPWFNALKGIVPDLLGKTPQPGTAEYELERILKVMGETSLTRDLALDIAERSMLTTWSSALRERLEQVPGLPERLSKMEALSMRLSRMKLNNELRYINSQIGDIVTDSIKKVREFRDAQAAKATGEAAELWRNTEIDAEKMLADQREQLLRAGKVPTDEEVGRHYLSELIADSHRVKLTKEGFLDFSEVMKHGEYHMPVTFGQLRPLDVEYGVRLLDFPNINTVDDLRQALLSSRIHAAEIVDRFREEGFHPDAIDRFLTNVRFSWRGYFDDLRARLGWTRFQMAAVEDLVSKQARALKMDPVDYLTQVLPMNQRRAKILAEFETPTWEPKRPISKVPDEVVEHTLTHGGGTFSRSGRELGLTEGYAVGWGSKGLRVPKDSEAIRQGFREVSGVGSPRIGTWIDQDNVVHIDPVDVLPSRDQALAVAYERGEHSIWDFAAQNDIPVRTTKTLDETMQFTGEVLSLLQNGKAGVHEIAALAARYLQPSMQEELLGKFVSWLSDYRKTLKDPEMIRHITETIEDLKLGWGDTADEIFREMVLWRAGGKALGEMPPTTISKALDAIGADTFGQEYEVERAARFVRLFLEQGDLYKNASTALKAIIDKIPVEGASPYHQTQDLLYHLLMQGFKGAEGDAVRLAEMQTERTVLERSLNHPFFGYYPTSYFWGKVIPETFKFIAREPFGINTGAGALTYLRAQQAIALQAQYDPGMEHYWDRFGKSSVYILLSYITPSLPWEDMRVMLPPWARAAAQYGPDARRMLQAQLEMMDPMRYVNLPYRAAKEFGGWLGQSLQQGAKESPVPQSESLPGLPTGGGPAQGGPAATLAPVLSNELEHLSKVLGGR